MKPLVVGHWGTTPGQNFIYVHLNRVIKKYDLDMFYIAGPGHGGPGAGRQYLPRGHLQRGLPRRQPGRGRAAEAVQAVLVSRRDLQPRRADDAGVDPRRRRARVLAQPCLRGRVRQPRPDRRLRHRRRRSRDRPAGHRVAVQQVPRPGHRRSGAADPAPQRLQDQQPDRARPASSHEELEQFLRGCGWTPHFVEGDDPGADAPADGRRTGRGHRGDPADPGRRTQQRRDAPGRAGR